MIGVHELRNQLAAATVAGVTGYPRRVDGPSYPCFVVAPPALLPYHRTHGRRLRAEISVTVYTSAAVSIEAAETRLDELTSYDQVPAALEATSTDTVEVVATAVAGWREFTLTDDQGNTVAELFAADIACVVTFKEE